MRGCRTVQERVDTSINFSAAAADFAIAGLGSFKGLVVGAGTVVADGVSGGLSKIGKRGYILNPGCR